MISWWMFAWLLLAVTFLQGTVSELYSSEEAQERGLYQDPGWFPENKSVRVTRDLKTQLFGVFNVGYENVFERNFALNKWLLPLSMTARILDKPHAPGEISRRDRITALFIKLLTRLFKQRPFQRLLCGSNATCLANLNSAPTY